MPNIHLVAAHGMLDEIGVRNRLPWKLPGDLQRFKKYTQGKVLLMGRSTFESIGRPLPGRPNLVLSRNLDFQAPGCLVVSSIQSAIDFAAQHGEQDIAVIGGARVYQQALGLSNFLYLTLVEGVFPEADTFLPHIDLSSWKLFSSETFPADSINHYTCQVRLYSR